MTQEEFEKRIAELEAEIALLKGPKKTKRLAITGEVAQKMGALRNTSYGYLRSGDNYDGLVFLGKGIRACVFPKVMKKTWAKDAPDGHMKKQIPAVDDLDDDQYKAYLSLMEKITDIILHYKEAAT